MHFGRVQDDRKLDLRLPDPRPRTQSFLELPHKGRGLIYCGAPIWSCPDWVATIYPENARPGEFLRHYARHYSVVEVNSSFYSLPRIGQVKLWCEQVGPEFRFCPKLPQDLSHRLKSGWDPQLLKAYVDVAHAFGDKHGTSFMQLPDGFAKADFPLLEAFVDQWDPSLALAIEFRHPSWFRDHMLLDPVINFLYRRGLSAVITDTPGQRDVLHMSLTTPRILLRFMGCFPSAKDDERLRAWLQRLMTWMEAGMDVAYVCMHQAKNGAIPQTVDFAIRYLYEQKFQGLVRPKPDDEAESPY